MEQSGVKFGEYKHWKGNHYEVIGVAKHSETQEEFVVYRALFDGYGMWIRPLKVFLEEVEDNGKKVPRFQYLGD